MAFFELYLREMDEYDHPKTYTKTFFIELFVIIILLLVMTMIKFFRKDYIMKRYNNYSISISEKKKEIYTMR